MSRGSMSPGFDQRIADWLEDDPDDAPDIVLATVLAAFPSIPQRRAMRVPWRFQTMSFSARFAAAAIAIAIVAVGGALLLFRSDGRSTVAASPGPSRLPSASPSASPSAIPSPGIALGPLEKEFRSALFGYSVDLPPSWEVTPATGTPTTIDQWSAGPDRTFDSFVGDRVRLIAVSAPPPAGMTPDEWIVANRPIECPKRPDDESVTIGDRVAVVVADTCGSIGPYPEWSRALLATDDRVYLFQLDADLAPTPKLLSLLRTVELQPAPTGTITASNTGTAVKAGTYRVEGFATPFNITLPSNWTLTGLTTNNVGFHVRGDSNVGIVMLVLNKVYADPCHPDSGPTAVRSGVDPLVAALSAVRDFRVANAREVTVGGLPGTAFDFINAVDVAAAGCSADPMPFATHDKEGDGRDVDVHMFSGETERFWALDAHGKTLLIAITNTPRIVAQAQPVFDSLNFGTPPSP
jgi:hypothetical protein